MKAETAKKRAAGRKLRFATIGAGFWASYQLAAWQETGGAECVAICNRTSAKAEALARRFGIASVYANAEEMLEREDLDFVDVITDVDTHPQFVFMALQRGLPVITQKPMAPSLPAARKMVKTAARASTPFFVHENWRWQRPIQELNKVLQGGTIGPVFRARLRMVSGFSVFANQPFLADLDRFIIMDMGSHILDTARFLFGEASTLFCQTNKVHKHIKGEDVATVMMRMGAATVTCEMGYPGNHAEHDRFPETYAFVEGTAGTIELGPDYWLRVTTSKGTHARRVPPDRYTWADPAYDLVHSSIVDCNKDLLRGLKSGVAQTSGADNLRTVELVFASYDSATRNKSISF